MNYVMDIFVEPSNVNYIQHIYQIVKENDPRQYAGNQTDYVEKSLITLWNRFENLIKSTRYDVLTPQLPECDFIPHKSADRVRTHISPILNFLFYIEGANGSKEISSLRDKDKEYGGSWCRRGGVGAFFVTVRKWDRIEFAIKKYGSLKKAIQEDKREEGIQDDLRDLRGYLILILAWHREVYR